jgi:hypothetical protein
MYQLEQRSRRAGHINLPMTRRDIADYLGLETVSRCLGQMQENGRLSLSSARNMELRSDRRHPRPLLTAPSNSDTRAVNNAAKWCAWSPRRLPGPCGELRIEIAPL